MVYECRPGETFLLGASTWRIEDITLRAGRRHPGAGPAGEDAVLARRPARPPARARPGPRRLRPRDPAAAAGAGRGAAAHRRRARRSWPPTTSCSYLPTRSRRPAWCPTTARSWSSASGTRSATGGCACSRPFGTPVHAPWAMAIERRLSERYDMAVETMWSDDGIVIRLPEAADDIPVDELLIDPTEIDELVVVDAAVHARCSRRASGSARPGPCCCPAAAPTRRTPLWQQRQRAADLLAVAAKYPTFPILLEASRECLQDVFDVPALRTVLADLRSRTDPPGQRRHARRRRRSPRACCSTGSPPTCTRATRRWPSAGPRRWRSTGTCCASCSAPRSCGS